MKPLVEDSAEVSSSKKTKISMTVDGIMVNIERDDTTSAKGQKKTTASEIPKATSAKKVADAKSESTKTAKGLTLTILTYRTAFALKTSERRYSPQLLDASIK